VLVRIITPHHISQTIVTHFPNLETNLLDKGTFTGSVTTRLVWRDNFAMTSVIVNGLDY
jgi:hypothetical protein